MSRSYKKSLWIKDRSPFHKKQANRKVRRSEDVPNGKAYRKFYESYDISDYAFQYDPHPLYHFWRGQMDVIEPEPLWKFRKK